MIRAVERSENLGGQFYLVGIICSLVEIGLAGTPRDDTPIMILATMTKVDAVICTLKKHSKFEYGCVNLRELAITVKDTPQLIEPQGKVIYTKYSKH